MNDTERLQRHIRTTIQKAVQETAEHLQSKAVEEAPKDKGTLKLSSPPVVARWEGHTCRATISFNTPYAAYQHEGVSRFSGRALQYNLTRNPSAKPKFLERNARLWGPKYRKLIVARVRAALAGTQ